MAEEADEKKDDGKNGDSKRLSGKEYERLVKGADDIFFGGLGETEGEEKPPHEKPAGEAQKSDDDEK